jgi:hypothetical protein
MRIKSINYKVGVYIYILNMKSPTSLTEGQRTFEVCLAVDEACFADLHVRALENLDTFLKSGPVDRIGLVNYWKSRGRRADCLAVIIANGLVDKEDEVAIMHATRHIWAFVNLDDIVYTNLLHGLRN